MAKTVEAAVAAVNFGSPMKQISENNFMSGFKENVPTANIRNFPQTDGLADGNKIVPEGKYLAGTTKIGAQD